MGFFPKKTKTDILTAVLGVLLVFFFGLVFSMNFSTLDFQEFSYLAKSFLAGKTYFLEKPGTWLDTAYFGEKSYWPLGPFPAVLLVPFVYFSPWFFYQGYLQVGLVFGVFYLVLRMAKKFKYGFDDALFWAFGFSFGSVFLNVAVLAWGWYFSQVVAVFLLWLTLDEFFGRKREGWMGVYLGLALATRASVFGAASLPVGEILLRQISAREKLRKLMKLLVVPGLIAVFLALYNWTRFENIWESGYRYQMLFTTNEATREYGILNLVHLPGNLYHFLLAGPLPEFRDGISQVLKFPFIKADPWGMGIFITSPYFLYLFLVKYKNRLAKLLLGSAVLTGLPIFLYYGIGAVQYGYRYSLDFLPLLFILLMIKYRENNQALSGRFKLMLLGGSLVNLFFLVTLR